MTKHSYPLLCLCGMALIGSGCSGGDREVDDKMNIILFVSDDHGTDALGCYGNPVIKTPHLDKLAEDGVIFSNAFCTSSSCSASRSAILTGKYGHATGHYGHSHDYHHFSTFDSIKSLPVYLEEAGYLTARIGKYHLAPENVYRFNEVIEANPRNTVEMAENCREVIRGKQPFFLYFCTDDPHRGAPFKNESWDTPNNFGNREEGYAGVQTTIFDPDSVLVPDFLPDTREAREELAQYYQSISRIDQGFGKLMEILNESGKSDNTLIIYISDNGIAFPGAKTNTYDPGIRVPCIIKDPTLKKSGLVNESMVSWVDITPTILDYAGFDIDTMYFHGRSFKSIIGESDAPQWDRIFCSHIFHEVTMYYPMRVVRGKQYKLIWNLEWRSEYPFASDLWLASTWQGVFRRGDEYYGNRTVKDYMFRPEFELYNILEDPYELNNLATDDSYHQILDSLKTEIRNFQIKTNDPWIIKWDHTDVFGGSGVNL